MLFRSQNMLLVLECGDEAKLATYHTKLMQTEWKRKEELSVEMCIRDSYVY